MKIHKQSKLIHNRSVINSGLTARKNQRYTDLVENRISYLKS